MMFPPSFADYFMGGFIICLALAVIISSRIPATPPPRKKRERLKLLHVIKTDKAEDFIYNTQTLQDVDWVNIEIERVAGTERKIILESQVFEDSYGAMCGSAFSSLVIDACNHVRTYIRIAGEFIISDKKVKE